MGTTVVEATPAVAPVVIAAPAAAPADAVAKIVTDATGLADTATPKPTRTEAIAALINGESPASKGAGVFAPGAEGDDDTPVVKILAPGETAPVTAAPEAAAPAAAATPEQAQLEAGTDVGTGDALFRIRDPKSGQFVPQDDRVIELAVRDKETGEVRVHQKSVAELARMARDGIAARRSLQELESLRQNVPAVEARTQQLEEDLRMQRDLNREMLTNQEKYIEYAERYAAQMAPENQLARLQREVEEMKHQRVQEQQSTTMRAKAQDFWGTRVQPVLNEAMQTLPPELVTGRLTIDTAHLLVNGVIPPAHWPQLDSYIRNEFSAWSKAESAKWKANATATQTATTATTEAARSIQKAKQDQARVIQPVGRAAPDAAAPLPPPKNRQEAIQRLVNRPLA